MTIAMLKSLVSRKVSSSINLEKRYIKGISHTPWVKQEIHPTCLLIFPDILSVMVSTEIRFFNFNSDKSFHDVGHCSDSTNRLLYQNLDKPRFGVYIFKTGCSKAVELGLNDLRDLG